MNINSVITTPGHDEILPVDGVTTQGGYTVKGYAYSGESRVIDLGCRNDRSFSFLVPTARHSTLHYHFTIPAAAFVPRY
jgi:hypothetical protein